jgi:hypothetical protein
MLAELRRLVGALFKITEIQRTLIAGLARLALRSSSSRTSQR